MLEKFSSWRWVGLSLVILALALRLPLLNTSFWLDEAAQVMESARPLSQQLDIAEDFQPPLLHLLTFGLLRVSTSEWFLRLGGALIPGLITIYLTWRIGKLLAPGVGVVAALLLATHSFHVFYSQELRPYSLPALWVVVGWWLLISASHNRPIKYWPVWYGLVTWAAAMSSYVALFGVAAQALWWCAWCWQKGEWGLWKKWLLASMAAGLGFFVWVPFFLEQLHVGTSLQSQLPGWSEVVGFGVAKNVGLLIGKLLFGISDLGLSGEYVVGLGLIAGSCAWFFWTTRSWWSAQTFWKKSILGHSGYTALAAWLVGSLALATIVSFIIPILQPKRVLFLWPAWSLFWASLVVAGWQRAATRLAASAVFAALLILNFSGLYRYYTIPALQREPWELAIHTLTARYPAADSVVVQAFTAPFAPWIWYAPADYPVKATGVFVLDDETTRATLEPLTETRYIIVFEYLMDLTDPQRQLQTALTKYGYTEVDLMQYPLIGAVRVYSKAGASAS